MTEYVNWQPLESDPEVFTSYVQKLGLTNLKFQDIYGFDDDLLNMLENPSYMLIQCFPSQKSVPISGQINSSFKFINQSKKLGNACGLIAILHGLMNNSLQSSHITPDSIIDCLMKQMNTDRFHNEGILASSDNNSVNSIKDIHKSHVSRGQSEIDDNTIQHFVTQTKIEDTIFQFDGHQEGALELQKSKAKNGIEFIKECEKYLMGKGIDEQSLMTICIDN